jgi:uncharacterized membrane protein YkoI
MTVSITAGSLITINTEADSTTAHNKPTTPVDKDHDASANDDKDSNATTNSAVEKKTNTSAGTNSSNDAGSNSDKKNESPSSNYISESDAQNIALQHSGGGKVAESTLDTDDGVAEYEITIINGHYEYEIDVDAITGKIIKADKEKFEDDDDHHDD